MAGSPSESADGRVTSNFRRFFETLPGMYLVLEPDLYILAATDEYLAGTLTVRDEIVGRYLFDVFPDDPASEIGRNMRTSVTRVLELGIADTVPLAQHDVRRTAPYDGVEERYWRATNTPILDDSGEVEYLIHRLEDVTKSVNVRQNTTVSGKGDGELGTVAWDSVEAKAKILARRVEVPHLHTQSPEASRQLQQSERILREVIDVAPAVISARDLHGHLLTHNRLFDALFRRPEDATGGRGHGSLPAPELLERVAALEKQVIETGVPVAAEVELPGLAGETSVYSFTKFPLRTPSGEIVGVGSIGIDVTAGRRGLEALLASDQLFRQMADNVDEVFILWEEGTLRMLYVSPAVETILGLDVESFCDPEGRLAIVHPDDRAIVSSAPAAFKEFRITRPDGEVRWIRSRSSMIETADGLPDRGVTTLVDFTDQKVAELAAQAARAEALAANEAKSGFLSRMSHELRTPLNAILGFGQLLAMDELSSGQRDAVEQVVRAGEHLLGIIEEVLDISRLETGELRLSMEPVNLRDVIDEATGMLRPLAERRHIRVVIDDCGLDVHVRADRQRLRQAVVNLLVNAIKYNREGGEARVKGEVLDAGRVRLTISDTGLGIAEGDLGRLFKPFERLSAELSDVEGTGLGLAVTERLVAAMQGDVGVSSRIGEGSSFWLELAVTDAPSGAGLERSHPAADRASLGSGRCKVVLYVEDNPSNVRLLERVVDRRPDVKLVVAMQGHLALGLAVEHRPDLILMDLHLPDMSGEDVLRGVRSDPRLAGTPVVVLSADVIAGRSDRLRGLGATGFLAKPFDIAHLLTVIDSAGNEAAG